ncbi:MAG: DAHL domain-containing protein [Pseudomonadota bacterium]|nr:DAHL domain-containing protein [Pseudomonadota bacterium]MEE3100520.1 DAHL domain-containing protein [Pseudomonadota bacterium]
MRLALLAAASTLGLVLASGCLLGRTGVEAEAAGRAAAALEAFERAENGLHRDLLRVRSGALRSYDPLVAGLDEMTGALSRLRGWSAEEAALAPPVAGLGRRLARTEALTERFKTVNALLQNSLAYFAALSDRRAATGDADGLAAEILRLSLDPSATDTLDRRLAEASDVADGARDAGAGRAALLAHARMLRRLLPESEALLFDLSRVMGGPEIARLAQAVAVRRAGFDRQASTVRQALYALSLALAAALVACGAELRARARRLRLRARIEREIARISSRLVAVGPGDALEAELRAGLGALAVCLRADRAWLTSDDGPGGLGPIEWRADAAPRGPASGRLVVAGEDGFSGRAALGFETARPGGFAREDHAALLRLGLDALGGALRRAALEAERERLEERLHRARLAETAGALASGIAHNVNNIVGAILGHSEIAAEHVPGDGRAARSIAEIRRAATRARDLVDQGLAWGRGAEAAEVVDLALLVEETRGMLEASLPPHARLEVRADAVARVRGNGTQLQQVMMNLAANAAQALDGPGRVTLSLALRETDALPSPARPPSPSPSPPASPPASSSRTCAVISVEDDGRGMDRATLSRVFEPFFTTRDGGFGLGLATVRATAEAHGGVVLATSARGRGARFEVWLPLAVPAPHVPASPSRGEGQSVAIVAADAGWRLRQEEVVAGLGYEPVGYANAEAAAAAMRGGRAFDAVLLRLAPEEPPLRSAAFLRAIAPAPPVALVASGFGGLGPAALADAGVRDVVSSDAPAAIARALARCLPGAGGPSAQDTEAA